ncbi:hypothetical protein DEO72_LG9g1555 [Vigna unguiculata]|uniref:Uncharacterized protein n=1 Tax=Vigna unguiculata TaxID=3917 RepID=A0A4D6N110_VIGUN|nr:hypothetical protein DEO72_LG9g1555 [Vigna unguiculata]
MVKVELEISNGSIFHVLRDASSAIGVVSWCCGGEVVAWFSMKGVGLVAVVTAWRVDDGCALKCWPCCRLRKKEIT